MHDLFCAETPEKAQKSKAGTKNFTRISDMMVKAKVILIRASIQCESTLFSREGLAAEHFLVTIWVSPFPFRLYCTGSIAGVDSKCSSG